MRACKVRPKRCIDVPRLDAVAIGERIRKARRKRGWFQNDLAGKIGTSSAVVSLWETGRRVPPRDAAIALAVALRRSLEWLFYGMSRRGRLHDLVPGGRR